MAPSGGGGPPATAYDWLRTAERHLQDARTLKTRGGSSEAVFHYAGLAVECALKAVIMKRERWNQWPSRAREPKLHKHDLKRLLKRAGLNGEMEAEKRLGTDLAANWGVVIRWDNNRPRYPHGAMPSRVATDMFRAVAHHRDGVFTWLQQIFRRS